MLDEISAVIQDQMKIAVAKNSEIFSFKKDGRLGDFLFDFHAIDAARMVRLQCAGGNPAAEADDQGMVRGDAQQDEDAAVGKRAKRHCHRERFDQLRAAIGG